MLRLMQEQPLLIPSLLEFAGRLVYDKLDLPRKGGSIHIGQLSAREVRK